MRVIILEQAVGQRGVGGEENSRMLEVEHSYYLINRRERKQRIETYTRKLDGSKGDIVLFVILPKSDPVYLYMSAKNVSVS